MVNLGTKTIRTERLLLRPLLLTDAKDIYESGSMGDSVDEAYRILEEVDKCYKDNNAYYHWGIEYEGKIIGMIKVFEVSQRDQYGEIGYGISPLHRNKGFMTESFKAVVDYMFSQVKIHRIKLQIRTSNYPSLKVAEKSGMILEGCQRKHFKESDDSFVDVNIYGMLYEDWKK